MTTAAVSATFLVLQRAKFGGQINKAPSSTLLDGFTLLKIDCVLDHCRDEKEEEKEAQGSKLVKRDIHLCTNKMSSDDYKALEKKIETRLFDKFLLYATNLSSVANGPLGFLSQVFLFHSGILFLSRPVIFKLSPEKVIVARSLRFL